VSGPSTYRATPNDPADWFSADELSRARQYQKPLARLRLVRGSLSALVGLVFIFGQVGPRLVDGLDVTNWVGQLVVVLLALELVALTYNPALDWWVDLVHDKRWGLSNQTGRRFATDQVKSFLLGLVVNLVLLVPLYWVIWSTEYWWLFGWGLVLVFSVVLGFLFPILIAPIFNKFTPLADDDLRRRLVDVASRSGVSIGEFLVADESKRSTRDNAYVAGLGATRRVVLYDTLLGHAPEIVEQVVAHEIGHWRLGHLRRQIPLVAALSFLVFLGLRLVSEWTWLYEQADVDGIGDPTGLPILLLAVQIGFTATGLVTSYVSRAFERQADQEALDVLRAPEVTIEMQRALHVKNLADLDPGLIKRLQASHPPAAERMAFARAWADQRGIESGV
jgi:STE24 endopeptidase